MPPILPARAPTRGDTNFGALHAIGRPKTRPRLLPTEHRKLVTQNQQFDVLGELAATAPHEQPQQRREHEIRERKEHPSMLPELTTAEIENRNLVLEPLRRDPGSILLEGARDPGAAER